MKQHVICIDGNVPWPHQPIPMDEMFEVADIRQHPVFMSIKLVYLKDGPEPDVGYLPRRFKLVPG